MDDMNKYNELIDRLIYIKDSHEDLSFREIEVINQACNVLELVGEQNHAK